nr:putative ribonuclease H-like domain-containing protein [Tanacetum cinerariifolium]
MHKRSNDWNGRKKLKLLCEALRRIVNTGISYRRGSCQSDAETEQNVVHAKRTINNVTKHEAYSNGHVIDDIILSNREYLQNEHYALWEVIKFGDSYKASLEETGKGQVSESFAKKKGRTVVVTTEDMQKRRNDVKARTTLLLALPDEHQLRFSNLLVIPLLHFISLLSFLITKVIEFGDSYKPPLEETGKGPASESSARKKGRTVAITMKDIQKRRNGVKARTTLLLALLDEHQLRFSKYEIAKELWEAILKTFGGNEAAKKTKKNQLKLQYGNFKSEGSETLGQTFNRLVTITLLFKKRRNDVKARTTLLLALPDEHQLRFSKYKTAQELWGAILKTFGGNEATKKTKKNQLKQQYRNFKEEGSGTLEQTFNRLQAIISHMEFIDRNRSNLDTMSLDDLYNHLKVYEPEVQKKSESNSQNMAFISSAKNNSGKGEVNTASIPTASTHVSPASADVAAASISLDTVCAYIASQSNGSQIKYEDINQIDEDDIEEMDIKWNITLLSMRAADFGKRLPYKVLMAPRSQDRGRREIYKQGSKKEEYAPKALMAIDGVGWDWSYMANEEENHALVADEEAPTEYALMAKSSSSSKNEEARDLIRTRRDSNTVMFPPPALVYSPLKKDMSWIGLPEFADDTITDYSGLYLTRGGKITGKGIIKTDKLEFENVYFVKDLKYNLFNVSQICDNKNSVLFTDSECIVLGRDFKLKDDTNVLLRTHRQHNMYSIDLNNIIPHKDLTCLVVKAFADESMLWHRRLGHLNFKTMNKLVRHNLVKGLPSKCFENDHTCVACLKGKQHKASCKTKLVNSVSKPLHTLHMDLFGPTSVSSLNHKWYCLVVTDDFSRFTWTFFLKTKDETSGILRNFITEIENLKDLKVKIIRCDNRGEFKNREMNEFCTRKGIKREFNNARTLQQNGVAERKNKTLIEAARTMLADAKLPVTFWAEVVKTACYVQNRVLVNKSQNKTPYELFNSRTPAIGFLKPFGCHVMILNTLDHLGKFDAKGDEGYFIGYSMSSKAFRVFNKRTKRVEENLHVEFLENKAIEKGAGPNWLFDIDSLTKSMNYVPVDACTNSTNLSENKLIKKGAGPNWLFDIDTLTNSMNYVPVVVAGTSSTNFSGTKDAASQYVKKDVSSLRYIALPNWFHEAHLEFSTSDTNGMEADLGNMEYNISASPTPTFRIHMDHPKSQIIGPMDSPVQTRHKSKEMEEQSFIATIHQKITPDLLQFCLFSCFLSQEEPLKDPSWPPGFQDPEFPNRVYKVEKAMYGLHQAPRAWYVLQKKDGNFLSQDKYVGDILKKFGYSDVRSANTPVDKENPYGKDGTGKDVDLHLYRSMIGSLMYLTASRPDIMFDVCACSRHQVTPKECHLHAVKRIFRYLKGHPKLGLWHPKESPFDLVAYSDSDYGGATQDRKSTTGGCQFLGRRLISWQCKKQTIVATSTTKAEYVAAASDYGQVLWIQN